MMRKVLVFVVIYLFGGNYYAQDLSFKGTLFALNQTGPLTKKWNYNVFVSTTLDAFSQTVNSVNYPASDLQLYVQPSLIYVHTSNLNFSGSYTYQRNNPLRSNFSNEHRLWQQVIFSIPFTIGKLTNRLRYEERFIQNRITGLYPFSSRLRYQLGYNRPLQGKSIDLNEFYLNMYNECYFSLVGAKNSTYSENWTYAGIGYDLGKMGRLELGYLYQVYVRNPAKDLRFLNLIQLMWVTNFKR